MSNLISFPLLLCHSLLKGLLRFSEALIHLLPPVRRSILSGFGEVSNASIVASKSNVRDF